MTTAPSPRLEILRAHREEIRRIARRHRARSVSVFGSAARGDDHERSDIDLLVEFEQGSSLFDLMHLQDDLEVLLGLPVDVVSVGALTARDDHIRAEAIPL
ncbi:MAG TPA: nucleotidyltransferase family protein [Nakamurella sp.]